MNKQAMIEQYKQILKNRNTLLVESNNQSPKFLVSESETEVVVTMKLGEKVVDSIKFQQLNG